MPWFYFQGKASVDNLDERDRTIISYISKFEKDEELKDMLTNGFDKCDTKMLEPIILSITKGTM